MVNVCCSERTALANREIPLIYSTDNSSAQISAMQEAMSAGTPASASPVSTRCSTTVAHPAAIMPREGSQQASQVHPAACRLLFAVNKRRTRSLSDSSVRLRNSGDHRLCAHAASPIFVVLCDRFQEPGEISWNPQHTPAASSRPGKLPGESRVSTTSLPAALRLR